MRRTVTWLLVGAIVLDVVYWTLWAGERDLIASRHTQAYYDFENAFPLADLWLGLACLLAFVSMVKGWQSALFWLLASGSAGLYLGCMDLLYDLEHDIFTSGGGGLFELFVVAVTWVFSITILTWSWRHRGELLGVGTAAQS